MVIKLTRCPNCNRKLQKFPNNNPLVDIRCEVCQFRAQVKGHDGNPNDIEIQGGGWEILYKTYRAGYTIPPLIIYWRVNHEIRFYPFLFLKHLKKKPPLPPTHKQAGYVQFNYVNLATLPYFVWRKKEYVKG